MRVGITGHQDIGPKTAQLLEAALSERLAVEGPVEGWSSLAAGADQLFARVLLDRGGSLVAVIPSADYAEGFDSADRHAFEALLSQAGRVIELPHEQAGEQAYWEAGQRVVDGCELLLAVWDGQAAAGLGGTADVVAYARSQRTPVEVLWPNGARRGG